MSQGLPNPGILQEKYKKGIFSDVQWWKQISTHFSDSTHQECMIFARIGHGPCYYHLNEIFAGVTALFVIGTSEKFCQMFFVQSTIIYFR